MDWTWVGEYAVPILVGGGGLAWVVDLIRARALNRKSNTEGAVLLLGSTADHAKGLHARIDRLEQERENDHAAILSQLALLRRHAVWDHMVYQRLMALLPDGETIPEPPPLFETPPA